MESKKRGSETEEVVFRDGRDEMNLVEFPLASISDRLPADTKSIVIESATREGVVRRLTISGSSVHGLPTAKDDEVLIALIQLSKLQGFKSDRVAFSRYQILQILDWPLCGQSYERVDLAINRWIGVSYFWENSWWDKENESWVDEKFGILDNAELYEREKRAKARRNVQLSLSLSWAKWNEVVFRSFRAGYIKHLDMDVYRALRLPLAKRLYRYLDKHFYRSGTLRYDVQRLAREKLGLFGRYDNANLRRILEPAILELEEKWCLPPASREERFPRPRRGQLEVVFKRPSAMAKRVEAATEVDEQRVVELELIARGVSELVAKDLLARHGEDKVREKIELHDHFLSRKDKRIGGNPSGFLVASIANDYALPKGFETREEREEKARRNEERVEKLRETKRREFAEAEEHRRQRAKVMAHVAGLSPAGLEALKAKAMEQGDEELIRTYRRAEGKGTIADFALNELLFAYLTSDGRLKAISN